MEGQSNQQNTLQLMLLNSGAGTSNHVSRSGEENPNPPCVVPAGTGRDANHWTCLPKPPNNYVEFLTETSTFLPKTTAQYVLGTNYSAVGSIRDVNEDNGIGRNFLYSDPVKIYTFKTTDSSTDIEVQKVKPLKKIINFSNVHSAATACNHCCSLSSSSKHTAAGFPLNSDSVNASTCFSFTTHRRYPLTIVVNATVRKQNSTKNIPPSIFQGSLPSRELRRTTILEGETLSDNRCHGAQL